MRRKRVWRRAFNFLLVLIGSYLLFCLALAKMYVSPPRTAEPRLSAFKPVSLPTGSPMWVSSGLLTGSVSGSTVYIFMHGYRGGISHFSELGTSLVEAGHEVVLAELSGHGRSPDPSCGFGAKEADTLVEAARWARRRYLVPPRVVVVGVSMGGTAAWLATQRAPEVFDAVVTEGAFTDLDQVSDRWFDRLTPQGHVVFWPVKKFASKMAGVDATMINPLEAARQWHGRPALVIHCGRDTLMQPSYAADLATASAAEVWIIPNAAHAGGCRAARDEYLRRLITLSK